MEKIFKKQPVIYSLLAFVGIIFVSVYFMIMPLIDKIIAKNYQIQEDAMKQEIIRNNISELPKIQEQYEIIEKNGDLEDVLLDKNKAVTLIENLEKMAEKSGNAILISVQEIDSKKVVTKNKSTTESVILENLPSKDYLQLKIELRGKYSSLVSFIDSLENFKYYCDIIGIKIDKEADTSVKAPSNAGIINPFSLSGKSDAFKIIKNDTGNLVSVLDIVFYMKKN